MASASIQVKTAELPPQLSLPIGKRSAHEECLPGSDILRCHNSPFSIMRLAGPFPHLRKVGAAVNSPKPAGLGTPRVGARWKINRMGRIVKLLHLHACSGAGS